MTIIYTIPLLLLVSSMSLSIFNRTFRYFTHTPEIHHSQNSLRNLVFRIPESLFLLQKMINPYYIINSYGLFAVMTTERLELIIEGSDDGIQWLPYEFKYKPGKNYKKKLRIKISKNNQK